MKSAAGENRSDTTSTVSKVAMDKINLKNSFVQSFDTSLLPIDINLKCKKIKKIKK